MKRKEHQRGGGIGRFWPLVGAILVPIAALSVYFFVALGRSGDEGRRLAVVYGTSLVRELTSAYVEAVARAIESVCAPRDETAERERACKDLMDELPDMLGSGPSRYVILLDTKTASIVSLGTTDNGIPPFLRAGAKKEEFFRMVGRARPGAPVRGYFCEDAPVPPDPGAPPSGSWYVTAVALPHGLLLAGVVPEEHIAASLAPMQDAQKELIRRAGLTFLAYALAVGIASAFLIGYIFCGTGRSTTTYEEAGDGASRGETHHSARIG
jgi:hypothetical protein